jgi:hypothetical protein
VPSAATIVGAIRRCVLVPCAAALVLSSAALSTAPAIAGAPAVPACDGGAALDFTCLEVRYETLLRGKGADAALADLASRRDENGFILAACHQLTHIIGRAAGRARGMHALDGGDPLCSSGYYHGVVEEVMSEVGRPGALGRAPAVCEEYRRLQPHSNAHYNCVHGMGHGFMAIYGSDVFASLTGCDSLADPWESAECYGGIFMENLTALGNADRPSKDLRPGQPLYPCPAVGDRYKPACYEKQTAFAVYVLDDDFAGVFALCAATPDVDFRDDCYHGLGGDIAIHTGKYVYGDDNRTAGTKALCFLGPDEGARTDCVVGAVTTIIRDLGRDDVSTSSLCGALEHAEMARRCGAARAAAIAALASQPSAQFICRLTPTDDNPRRVT